MERAPGEWQPDAGDELIEAYLDELLLALRGRPRDARRLLAEAEGHLRESVAAGVDAGLGRAAAAEEAIRRFGPPSVVTRGVRPGAAYRALAGQLAETALLLIGLAFLAVGAAAVPAAIVGLTGHAGLITGDGPGLPAPARCAELRQLTGVPGCAQALSDHHVQEVIRSHFACGWLGVVLLAGWWVLHVSRRSRPTVLPAGFSLVVCGAWLGIAAVVLLVIGIRNVALGADSTAGVIGSGDLAATGATMMAAALCCGAVLAQRATGWPRLWQRHPAGAGARHPH